MQLSAQEWLYRRSMDSFSWFRAIILHQRLVDTTDCNLKAVKKVDIVFTLYSMCTTRISTLLQDYNLWASSSVNTGMLVIYRVSIRRSPIAREEAEYDTWDIPVISICCRIIQLGVCLGKLYTVYILFLKYMHCV